MTRPERYIVLGVLIWLHLGNDVFLGYCWDRGFNDEPQKYFIAAMAGICTGQFLLLSIWSALASGPLIVRLPWSLLLGTLIWYAVVIGRRMQGNYVDFQESLTLGVVLLGGLLIVQLPLWLAGKGFSWRLDAAPPIRHLATGETRQSDNDPGQFNIRHLLLGTGLVSFTLAMGRFVLPAGDFYGIDLNGEMWVIVGMIVVVNMILATPCVWGAFADWRVVLLGTLVWPVYCILVTAVEFTLLVAVLGPPGNEAMEVAAMFGIFNLFQCLSVFSTLICLRLIGYRFSRQPKSLPAAV